MCLANSSPYWNVELLLPALVRRASGQVALFRRVAKYGGAKLLIDQDAGFFLGHTSCDSGLEAFIDNLLGGGDLVRLLRSQRAVPAEHSRFKRATMVKGQDI